MNHLLRTILYLSLSFLTLLNLQAQRTNISSSLDTIAVDSVQLKVDTLSSSANSETATIDAPIVYAANDSTVILGNGIAQLYGNTDVSYKEMNLKEANFVRIRMDSAMFYAYPTRDSTGVLIGKPIFKDKESEYLSDEIIYNFKSRKGFVNQAVTQQGEGYIISQRTKIMDKEAINMIDGKYTTCDLHDHPHFYLSLSKAKVRPGKEIVAGPSHIVLLDVPIPLGLPFGFFPFNSSYSSGVEMPSFVTDFTRGYGFTNGGYYFAINDYVDLSLKGDIYTRGTWSLNANSNYIKRYAYGGGFSVNYREDVISEKDMPDYSKSKNLSIRWSHSQNTKANPYRTFSASVNFSTSGYNRSNINSYYSPVNAENTKSSSISFSQRFPDNPFSITANLGVNQRTKDSTISLTLPNISISMSRIYPLKRKSRVGKERWYEKISMSYSGAISNSITTKENKLLHTSLADDWRNGMSHSIPISASFSLWNFINISPSFNYKERWYLRSTRKEWDDKEKKEIVSQEKGFKRAYDFNASITANTTLYGMYQPNKKIFGDKILAIRHKFDPSIGLGYRPDFGDPSWGFWDSYTRTIEDPKNPALSRSEEVYYSRFENALYGSPSRGKTGNVFFSLGNNIEMKVKNENDTTENAKKTRIISLIDQFSVGSGYNFAVDSMRWSNFSANLRIKLKSYTINLSGAFDPYMYALGTDGKSVKRVNQLRWNYGKFPRFLGTSLSYSYTISNETFSRKSTQKGGNTSPDDEDNKTAYESDPNNPNYNTSLDVQNTRKKQKRKTSPETGVDGYEKFAIPWSLSVNYSVRFGDGPNFDYERMEYKRKFSHNLNFSGNVSLTPGWTITGTTSYDFTARQFAYTSFNVTRNLHCWTLTGNFVPLGPFKTYNFRIGVNSSMLSDLKYEKQGNRGRSLNNVTWY